jgi:MFS superfamily sulfate permease-like transporter
MSLRSAFSDLPSSLPDAVAGLSVAGLLVPEAVAYASIAGLTPEYGITALLAGLVCYGLVGQSRFAIVSATSSSAAVLAAATLSLAPGDAAQRLALAAGLILLTGVFFLLAGAARLGAMSDFVAKPVLRGFAFGLALVIVVRQLPAMLGVPSSGGSIVYELVSLGGQFARWNGVDLALGLGALALLWALRRFQRVPGGLLVIALGIALQALLQLDRHGVALVGTIHLTLKPPTVPDLTRLEWLRLGELAFAMVFVLFAESYGSVRSLALRHGDALSADRELLALGVANLASGLLGGMPVGAGYSATSANEAAGAESRRAAWLAALCVLAVVLTLLPWVALTPLPVLAAVVVNAMSHALRPGALGGYFTWQRDRVVLVIAVAAVLTLGVLDGLLAAVGASLLMTLRDLSQPNVSVLGRLGTGHDFVNLAAHPEARPVAGLLIMRPEAPLFFGNVDRMLAQVRQQLERCAAAGAAGGAPLSDAVPCHTLVLSLEESPDLDGSSVEALLELVQLARSRGIRLLLARLHGPVRDVLARAAPLGATELELTHWSVDDAVSRALEAAGG